MSHMPPADLKERQDAVDTHASWIIRAPAGSGKTRLLVERYLKLLAEHVSAPEQILALTFTRKAASEMRARVLAELNHREHPLAQKVMQQNQTLNWALETQPNRLQIMTIDAFSQGLAKQPDQTQPKCLESADALYTLASDNMLRRLDQTPIPDWAGDLETVLMRLDHHYERANRLFAYLLSKRDQWLPLIGELNRTEDVQQLLTENLNLRLKSLLIQLGAQFPEALKAPLIPIFRHCARTLCELEIGAPICALDHLEDWPTEQLSDLPIWRGICSLLITLTGQWRKSIDRRQGILPKQAQKSELLAYLSALAEYPLLLETMYHFQSCPAPETLDLNTTLALLKVLPIFAASLEVCFKEHNVIDYTGISLKALNQLESNGNPTDLSLALDYRIQHLLIDECQDTSLTQYRLFERLTAGWEADDGRTLFMVGDPMQSIYRFRQADVSLFLHASKYGLGSISPKTLNLRTNFRSNPDIVNWLNQALPAYFPLADNLDTQAVAYQPCVASRPEDAGPHVHQHDIDLSNPQQLQGQLKRMFAKICGTNETAAILVRSRRHAGPIIRALERLNLSFEASVLKPLTQRPEINDLLSLAQFLFYPDRALHLFALLASPLFGISLIDLEKLRANSKLKQCSDFEAVADFNPEIFRGLKALLDMQMQHMPASWIHFAWTQLSGWKCYPSEDAHIATDLFFETLDSALNPETGIDFSLLQTQLSLAALPAKVTRADENPIRIMTIHQSKGLEFDHVCVVGMQERLPPSNAPLLLWTHFLDAEDQAHLIMATKSPSAYKDPLYQYLQGIEKAKAAAEHARLFYVACTRAREQLHILSQES